MLGPGDLVGLRLSRRLETRNEVIGVDDILFGGTVGKVGRGTRSFTQYMDTTDVAKHDVILDNLFQRHKL